jgi:acetyl esterase
VVPPKPVLELPAERFAADTADPPYLSELSVADWRRTMDGIQSGNVSRPAATIEEIDVEGGPTGGVTVRLVRPAAAIGRRPALLYLHGGWVAGSALSHDRLVRELATRADAAAVFVEYDRSPEARYPVAVEQSYAVLEWVAAHGDEYGLDPDRIAIAGDSGGRDDGRGGHPDREAAVGSAPRGATSLLPGD